mgnify:FL=1
MFALCNRFWAGIGRCFPYRRWACVHLFVLAIFFVSLGCVTKGTSPSVSRQDVVGTWIGEDPTQGIRCELRVDEKLTGLLGMMFLDQEPEITAVRGLVRQTSTVVTLAMGTYPKNKPGYRTLDLRPFSGGLFLQVAFDGAEYSLPIFRESMVEDRRARLKGAMDAVGIRVKSQ